MSDKKIIYMDNNATTRVYQEVLDAMLPYFKDQYYNPSSMYSPAGAVHKEMEKARAGIRQNLRENEDKLNPVVKRTAEGYVLPRNPVPGDKVIIVSVGQHGEVVSEPDTAGNIAAPVFRVQVFQIARRQLVDGIGRGADWGLTHCSSLLGKKW